MPCRSALLAIKAMFCREILALTSKVGRTSSSSKGMASSEGAQDFKISEKYNTPMNNVELAQTFEKIANLLEIKGEVVYVTLAYRRAADSLRILGQEAETYRATQPLTSIPGVGPKKVALFWKQAGITSLNELETAAQERQLRSLPGMGEKSEQRILEGIAALRRRSHRMTLGVARPIGVG